MMMGGAQQGGANKDEEIELKSILDMEAMRKNMRQIDLVRIVMFMVAGSTCGVLGFTDWYGFAFYIASSVIISLALTMRMGFDVKSYINSSILQLTIVTFNSQLTSFIMFWTLTYSLVYIY